MNELRALIHEALKNGRKILEVQGSKSVFEYELEAAHLKEDGQELWMHSNPFQYFKEPTGQLCGTVFGFPFRDTKNVAIITA